MFKSKNKKIISIVILIFLILGGAFFLIAHKTTKEIQTVLPIVKIEDTAKTQLVGTTLEVNGVVYAEEIIGKTSVYDFMSKMQNEGKINFVEKNYIGMGEFITEINGIKNNNQKSWIYYVNGKEASVGVSNYKLNPGDVVSWKYEKSTY